MAVYVDHARGRYGRMRMSHLLADTSAELHALARQLGLKRIWCQYEGTYREHYDVSEIKRTAALRLGAQPITRTQLAVLLRNRRPMSDPRQYDDHELPLGWTPGMRVRILAEEGEPEEFGALESDCVMNGTVIVQLDEPYRDGGDDGIREVMLEFVVPEGWMPDSEESDEEAAL